MRSTLLVQLAVASLMVCSAAFSTHRAVFHNKHHSKHLKKDNSNCATVSVRKEWRNLTTTEQYAYLASQKCIFNLPAQLSLGSTNRWEDLVALHQNLTAIIHNVGQFHPWHRYSCTSTKRSREMSATTLDP